MDQVNGEGSLLDIGCGHGLFLQLVKRKYPQMKCAGYDHDSRKIELARTAALDKDIVFLDREQWPPIDGMVFDYISLVDVLYAIPLDQWVSLLTIASKHLSSSGSLIIKETVNFPNWKFHLCLFQETMAVKVLKYTKGAAPHLMPVGFFEGVFARAGLTILEQKRLDSWYLWPHYLFICKKNSQ
ncbi:MAG: class I SAM-dependent methyltransferase [Bacteroidetes bacterium]|nr:class I SAM-dependent methyltransferase [Bacteroidota bacterium]